MRVVVLLLALLAAPSAFASGFCGYPARQNTGTTWGGSTSAEAKATCEANAGQGWASSNALFIFNGHCALTADGWRASTTFQAHSSCVPGAIYDSNSLEGPIYQWQPRCELGDTGPPPTAGNITANAAQAIFQCLEWNQGQFVDRHSTTSSTVYDFKECRDQGSPATFYQAIFDVTTHSVQGDICTPGITTTQERAQYSWAPDDSCANLTQTLPPTWEQDLYCSAGCEYQVVSSCGHGSVGCMLAAESTGAGCGSNWEPPPPPEPDPSDDPDPDPPPGGDPGDTGNQATNEHLGPKLDAIAEAVRRHQTSNERVAAETQAAIAAVVNDQTSKLGAKQDATTGAVNAGTAAIVDAIGNIGVGEGMEVQGGGECGSPPSCNASVGDCIMVVNLYRLRCGSDSDLGDNAGAIAVVDGAIEHFTGFNPGDWEIPGGGDGGEMDGIDAVRYTQEIDDSTFDDSGFMGGGSCPAFTSIPVAAGAVGIDYQAICDLLTWVSYFVLALAWFQAVRIIAS